MKNPLLKKFLIGLSAVLLVWLVFTLLPLPDTFSPYAKQEVITVLDRRGRVLREAPPKGEARRVVVRLEEVDKKFLRWLIASEDKNFFSHRGIDLPALARAFGRNLKAGRIVQGGSTITMQTIRLCLPKTRFRWWGKVRELLWAPRLERQFSKQEILALYLNRLSFAQRAEGLEMASRNYFSHGVSTLSGGEASLLVSLISAPSLDPIRHPQIAEKRRKTWVRRLHGLKRLNLKNSEAKRLISETPLLFPTDPPDIAPSFVNMVLAQVPPEARTIETTLDADLQTLIESEARAVVGDLATHKRSRAAVVVTRTQTSEVLTWIGDAASRPGRERYNLPMDLRQPGSALKPFTYAMALEGGMTAADLLADIPTAFKLPKDAGGGQFEPKNYDGRFHGPVRLRVALANSLNVAAVDLAAKLGVKNIWKFYRRLGLGLPKSWEAYGVGITLGNAEVRLANLTNAYSTLGRLGLHKNLRFIRRYKTAGGKWQWPKTPKGERLLSPESAFVVGDILRDDLAREAAFGRRSVLTFPFPVAAKTGTSTDYRDNWALGYTPLFTVGVWVGNVSGASLGGVSGITGAGPLFQRAMRLTQGRVRATWPEAPKSLEKRPVCALNGMGPSETCPGIVEEWLPRGKPLPKDNWTRGDSHSPDKVIIRYPPKFIPWASSQGESAFVKSLAPESRSETDAEDFFTVLRPPFGKVILLSAALPKHLQVLHLATTGGAGGPYQWFLDEHLIGKTVLPTLPWKLKEGRFELKVLDRKGQRAFRQLEVQKTEMDQD